MIRFFTKDIKFNLQCKLAIKNWIKTVVQSKGYKLADVNIIFCSDECILDINKQFLKHDYYTDIITFDYCEDSYISGELYISIDTVKANAIEYKQEFFDELHRVIIHGILHLCKLDDHSEEDIKQMRKAENDSLLLLKEFLESR